MRHSRESRASRAAGCLACAALLVAAPHAAAAQALVLAGEVVNPDGRTAAPAVLVEVYDAQRLLAGRTLTDSAGRFALGVAAEGSYTVIASRVGYRASVTVVGLVRALRRDVRIVLTNETVRLSTARITTNDVCGPAPDGGALVGAAWEEVRKAVASAAVVSGPARDSSDVTTWHSYRRFDANGPIWQDVGGRRFPNRHAAGTATLAEGGHAPGGAVDYFGPDAEKVVSDEFVATHCFHLTPSPSLHAGEVGVAFRPTRTGMSVVAISGTAWIDTATAILRRLEYTYTDGPPEFGAIGAGGWIEFGRSPSGLWIVRRWFNLVPAPLARLAAGRGRPRTVSAATLPVIASGGSVVAAGAPAPGETVGALRAELRGDASEGTTIELADAGLLARAGTDGRVVVGGVAPGPHAAIVSTEAIRGLALPPIKARLVAETAGARTVPIDLPSARDLLAARCGSDAARRGVAVVFGHVGGRAVAQVMLSVADDTMSAQKFGAVTDDMGRWYVCGVPRGVRMRAVIQQPGRAHDVELIFDVAGPVVRARLPGDERMSRGM